MPRWLLSLLLLPFSSDWSSVATPERGQTVNGSGANRYLGTWRQIAGFNTSALIFP
jgi:lipocalin